MQNIAARDRSLLLFGKEQLPEAAGLHEARSDIIGAGGQERSTCILVFLPIGSSVLVSRWLDAR